LEKAKEIEKNITFVEQDGGVTVSRAIKHVHIRQHIPQEVGADLSAQKIVLNQMLMRVYTEQSGRLGCLVRILL
jgi:hypothetical protein